MEVEAESLEYYVVVDFAFTVEENEESLAADEADRVRDVVEVFAVALPASYLYSHPPAAHSDECIDERGKQLCGVSYHEFQRFVRPLRSAESSAARKLSARTVAETGVSQLDVEGAHELSAATEALEDWGRALCEPAALRCVCDPLQLSRFRAVCARLNVPVWSALRTAALLAPSTALLCPPFEKEGRRLAQRKAFDSAHRAIAALRAGDRLAPQVEADKSKEREKSAERSDEHRDRDADRYDNRGGGSNNSGSSSANSRSGGASGGGSVGGGGGGGVGGGSGAGYGGGQRRADPPRRQGDWDCPTCGALVFSSKPECFKCHTPRPSSGSYNSSNSSSGGGAGRRPGDWNCKSCNSHNYASRTSCFRCKQPQGAGGGAVPMSGGAGRGGYSGGYGGGYPPVAAAPQAAYGVQAAYGYPYGSVPQVAAGYGAVGYSPYGVTSVPAASVPGYGAAPYGGGAGAAGGAGAGGAPRRKYNDWICPKCSAKVYESRSSCFKCATPKP